MPGPIVNISIACTACGHELLVTKKQLGKTAQCPACSALIQLPAPVDLGPRLKAPPPVDPTRAKPEAKSLPTFAMACPACGVRMRLLEKYRDSIVRCPDCNEPFKAEKPIPAPKDGNTT
jgi:predicted nucleic acid-binding Zn ribbon protein